MLPSRVYDHPKPVSAPLLWDDPLLLPHRGHSMEIALSHRGLLATTSLEMNPNAN